MKTSVVTKQGFSHNICEDYSLCDENTVIVCDGCSSSSHSEVGAMLLAYSAMKIKNIKENISGDFGRMSIEEAYLSSRVIEVDKDSLTSTLIIASYYNENLHIRMYGDGIIILKDKKGVITVLDHEYENNAPYYLRYEIDNKEKKLFQYECTKFEITENDFKSLSHPGSRLSKYPSIVSVNENTYDEVIILTDGIKTYADSAFKVNDENDLVNLYRAISKDQKNINGDFAKRRLRIFERSIGKELKNYDDFSMGIVNFRE